MKSVYLVFATTDAMLSTSMRAAADGLSRLVASPDGVPACVGLPLKLYSGDTRVI